MDHVIPAMNLKDQPMKKNAFCAFFPRPTFSLQAEVQGRKMVVVYLPA